MPHCQRSSFVHMQLGGGGGGGRLAQLPLMGRPAMRTPAHTLATQRLMYRLPSAPQTGE